MRTHRCGHTCRSKIPKGSTVNGGILSGRCRTLSHVHRCNKLGWHEPKLVHKTIHNLMAIWHECWCNWFAALGGQWGSTRSWADGQIWNMPWQHGPILVCCRRETITNGFLSFPIPSSSRYSFFQHNVDLYWVEIYDIQDWFLMSFSLDECILKQHCRVCALYEVTLLNRTCIFEWYTTRLIVTNFVLNTCSLF